MQDAALLGSAREGRDRRPRWTKRLHDFLPRGNTLDDAEWRRRHRLLELVLLFHIPALIGVGVALDQPVANIGAAALTPLACLLLAHVVRHRRWASFFATGGLVFCSVGLVLLTRGTIEAHFHFFVIIAFIALYQDWVPFLWNVTVTVLSHGLGTAWLGGEMIFNHAAAQAHPWVWSFVHGVAVLAACLGMVILWRMTEEQEGEKELNLQQVTASAETEIGRRQFTSNMLVNLARRNQSMLYRQLDIINQLEDKERDPDALADLFKIDHLATRIRRNAENLLVLAGEQPPRTWSAPVALRDVVRAAIAETEDLDRVVFAVDERVSVAGGLVADLTHLLAELTENAVRFSPPETVVTIRARPNRREEGGHLLTVEDWGVGMPPDDLADANDLLAHPREVEASVSQRLGFHVVARLAARHGIVVSLTATPGSGITAVAILPPALFALAPAVLDVRPPSPDPAETTRLPVTGNVADLDHADIDHVEFDPAGFDPAELDHPGKDRAETIRGTDIGPVRHGRPARPVTEPVMPAAERGTVGPWSGWWLPDQSGATNGQAGNGAAPDVNGSVNGQVNGHGHAPPLADALDGADEFTGPDDRDPAPESGPAVRAPEAAPAAEAAPAPAAVPELPERGAVDGCPDVEERPGVGGLPKVGGRPEVVKSPAVAGPRNGREPAVRPAPGGPAPGVPTARAAEMPRIPAPAAPPAPGHRPLTAVPHPRTDEPAAAAPEPRAPQPGAGGRSLRRRVPQTHLAPELRLAVSGLADTAAPPAADAAASALSRYQASRRAAQASVDISDVRPDGEGARA